MTVLSDAAALVAMCPACSEPYRYAGLLCVPQINEALKEELKTIHALSIKKSWTPAQQEKQQSA